MRDQFYAFTRLAMVPFLLLAGCTANTVSNADLETADTSLELREGYRFEVAGPDGERRLAAIRSIQGRRHINIAGHDTPLLSSADAPSLAYIDGVYRLEVAEYDPFFLQSIAPDEVEVTYQGDR